MSGRRVLVADDDDSLRMILTVALSAEGFEVEEAHDGAEAHLLAVRNVPDLIVLDWMMPKLDGIEVLRLLRGDARTSGTPVVLLTARATDDEVWQGWEAGADYYVTKPFNIDELLNFVRYLFPERRESVAGRS